jgi:hypothetical protein
MSYGTGGMIVDIDGSQIQVTPDQPIGSKDCHPMAVALWTVRSLEEMTVPEIVAAGKAMQEVRRIMEAKGFRVVRMMGETILPGE